MCEVGCSRWAHGPSKVPASWGSGTPGDPVVEEEEGEQEVDERELEIPPS